jgi:DUF4097 and DUF4098 domain-containing protein YvlB
MMGILPLEHRTGLGFALAASLIITHTAPAAAQDVQVNVQVRVSPNLARDVERIVERSAAVAVTAVDEALRPVLRDLAPVVAGIDLHALSAQNRDFRAERTDRDTRTLPLGASGSLELKNVSGDISVVAGSGRDVVVDIARRSRARTDADAALGLKEVQTVVDHRGERASVETVYPRGRHPYQVNTVFTVTAPAGTRVTVNSVSGNVTVREIKGDVAVEVTSGNVAISGAGRVPQARSVSGNVTLTDVNSDSVVSAGTLSGDTILQRVRANRLAVDIVSGNIRATDVTCQNAQLKSLSGDVEFSGPLARSGKYELNSHSGSVHFMTDGAVGFQLQASTFSGRIRPDASFPLSASSAGRGSLRATVGDGSAVVVAQTFSGDVVIGRR